MVTGAEDLKLDDDSGSEQGGAGGSAAAGGSGGDAASGGASGGSGAVGGQSPSVCPRWSADRADMTEGSWSGSVAGCDAGDTSADGRERALKLVNLYRFMAGLSEVTTDASRNAKTQQCALMMHANGALSHNPPSSWQCYTSDGAQAAGSSNIATTPGVQAVDLYMADPGNETTMGHRRWILSPSLGPIGLGSTDGYSCMWVLGGSGGSGASWIAFPSPGPFPIEAMTASWASVDETGWTVQSDAINLGSAQVTITDAGQDRPVNVSTLAGGYGSSYAIKMIPQGWTSTAGHTYEVDITGIAQPISYDVEMVHCP